MASDVTAHAARRLEEALRTLIDSEAIYAAQDPDDQQLVRVYMPVDSANKIVQLIEQAGVI